MTQKIEHTPVASGQAKKLDAFKEPEFEIEKFADLDATELERFMEELVLVMVHPSQNDGELPVAVPSVNGINQPIVRGREQWIKRKYVEAIARTVVIKYRQQIPDPRMPENFQMEESKIAVIPMDILKDTDRGIAWFKNLRQAV